MADRFYSADIGNQMPVSVVEQASTSSKVVELRVNDTVYTRKLDVIIAVEALLNYLKTKETSPIA